MCRISRWRVIKKSLKYFQFRFGWLSHKIGIHKTNKINLIEIEIKMDNDQEALNNAQQ